MTKRMTMAHPILQPNGEVNEHWRGIRLIRAVIAHDAIDVAHASDISGRLPDPGRPPGYRRWPALAPPREARAPVP
jgi:hypothetical protein